MSTQPKASTTGPFRATTRPLLRDPNHVATYYNRGRVYAAKGERDRAIQDYNQALLRDPNHVAAYYNRGNVYAAKGAYNQAKRDFSKALELGYDRAAVEARLAELRQEQEGERRERAEAAERERERRGILGRLWSAFKRN